MDKINNKKDREYPNLKLYIFWLLVMAMSKNWKFCRALNINFSCGRKEFVKIQIKRIYSTLIRSVILYGLETMNIIIEDKEQIWRN